MQLAQAEGRRAGAAARGTLAWRGEHAYGDGALAPRFPAQANRVRVVWVIFDERIEETVAYVPETQQLNALNAARPGTAKGRAPGTPERRRPVKATHYP